MKGLCCVIGNCVGLAIRLYDRNVVNARKCMQRVWCSTRCTRHGVDVDQLLWRLLADVKQRFELARNVPNEAERLSWELPRFLDLAARKGRVIIVIDGLHRLQDKSGKDAPRSPSSVKFVGEGGGGVPTCTLPRAEPCTTCIETSPLTLCPHCLTHLYAGGETGLQWLPLQVPGNVRIIVTATHPNPDYLQLHEQKIRQHVFSQPSGSIGGRAGNGGGSSSIGRGQQNAETEGPREAEYESSHRRRKASRQFAWKFEISEIQAQQWYQVARIRSCASIPLFGGDCVRVSRTWR